MSNIKLLYEKQIPVNDSIKIVIPTVGDIIDSDESSYYGMVSSLTSSPYDMMAQLDEAGVDFTKINSYDLFLLLFPSLQAQDTSLIFGDLDLTKFKFAINEQTEMLVLLDVENDITIDKAIYEKIAMTLRAIHHLEKNNRKPANEEAKKYLLEKAKRKLRRQRNRKQESQLEPLIVAMVNTEQYKFDFERTKELSIYQFNECVKQVINKIAYDNRMHGVYSGTISVKDLSQDDLNWLVHK